MISLPVYSGITSSKVTMLINLPSLYSISQLHVSLFYESKHLHVLHAIQDLNNS